MAKFYSKYQFKKNRRHSLSAQEGMTVEEGRKNLEVFLGETGRNIHGIMWAVEKMIRPDCELQHNDGKLINYSGEDDVSSTSVLTFHVISD